MNRKRNKNSIRQTSANELKFPWDISVENWEESHHDDLIEIYEHFFETNKKFECNYTDFVVYCYNHSIKVEHPNKCLI